MDDSASDHRLLDQRVRAIQIIAVALVLGRADVAGIVLFVILEAGPCGQPATAGYFLRRRGIIRVGVGRSDRAGWLAIDKSVRCPSQWNSAADVNANATGRPPRHGKLLSVFQTKTIITGACSRAQHFASLVAYMIERQPLR